jgi:anti-sigma B factor antagonist
MKVSRRFEGAVAVLDLTGRLIVSPGEVELVTLRTMIRDLIDAGRLHIVVNLSGLTHIDARGLGELAFAMKTLHMRGGRLTLTAASPRVARMLAITRLDTVFERCDEPGELTPAMISA